MEVLHEWDVATILAVNQFAGKSFGIDFTIYGLTTMNLVKFVPLYTAAWWLWFRRTRNRDEQRIRISMTFLAVLLTIVVSRLLQNLLPERPRPLHADIGFQPPLGVNIEALANWSSFPSDHAAIALALSLGLLACSYAIGALALAWSVVVISLPRVYAGLHYPGDILAGAVLGAAILVLIFRLGMPGALERLILRFEELHPSWFYSAAFLLTYNLATLLDDARRLGEGLAMVLL